MRTLLIALFLICLLDACAGPRANLPQLTNIASQPDGCPTLFPRGSYQFVHVIDFSMPGGKHGTAMGVTALDGENLQSVLMTVEGFVLFSATLTGKKTLKVERALPPFNSPGFAEGIMNDIKAIFLQPEGTAIQGVLKNGEKVCRTTSETGIMYDFLTTEEQCQQLSVYSHQRKLQTRITGCNSTLSSSGLQIPEKLELQSSKRGGYTLQMTLISAQ